MADEEHLEILRQGVEAWNRWREENPDIRPVLSEANLSRADLSGANLVEADLSWVNLREANLTGVNLREANLREANLTGVNLSQANLREAYLFQAKLFEADVIETNLSRADLFGTDLRGAYFSGADLRGAILAGARTCDTVFANLDLSEVKGLRFVEHLASSPISVDTLHKSKGEIPDVFLRGCGLADWEIEAAKMSRLGLSNEEISVILYRLYDLRAHQAIQINPLFISYSHKDGTFVDHLECYLNEKGIRFWRDVHHATAGRLEKQIDHAIRHNPTVVSILSEHSVKSDWVQHEARLARKLEIESGRDVLCPIALDDSWKTCRWPERLREQIMEYNILDFSDWQDETTFERMFTRLIDGLDLFYKE